METNMTRTKSYVMTISLDDPEFTRKVDLIRRTVRWMDEKSDTKHFIRVRGRLGKNSKFAHLYAVGAELHRYHSQDIKLEHSERADIYVSRRSRDWRKA
jgi:hypothetical protein